MRARENGRIWRSGCILKEHDLASFTLNATVSVAMTQLWRFFGEVMKTLGDLRKRLPKLRKKRSGR